MKINYAKGMLSEYQKIAKKVRQEILEMIYRTKGPHIGSSFSMVELLVALYFKVLQIDPKTPHDPQRDRFILSKGHGCPGFYPVLCERGFFGKEVLDSFAVDGGTLEGHPTKNVSFGIETTTGSVGHGLSLASGMALAAKYDKANYRVFTILGDGELDEGSNWEAMMFARHNKLDNLVAIVDHNKLQIMGTTSEVMNLDPLSEKWRSFGWEVKEIDGHNFQEIFSVLENVPFQKERPSCVIAHTVKGKGVSFMENEVRWHDKYPDDEEYKKAKAELS